MAVRAAARCWIVICAVAFAGAVQTGCDDSNKSEREVRAALTDSITLRGTKTTEQNEKAKQMLKLAADSTAASNGSRAQAKALLAQVHLDAAQELLQQIDLQELDLAQVAFEAGQLAVQLDVGAILLANYRQWDPNAVRTKIDTMIATAQGSGEDANWQIEGKTLPTAAVVKQNIAKLDEELGKLQAQAKSLEEQRSSKLTEAEAASRSAEAAQGSTAVEEFKTVSKRRREAADLFTQIELTNAMMVPIQRDLEILQGQLEAVEKEIEQFQAESAQLDKNWKELQAQMAAQVEISKRVAGSDGSPSSDANDSIAAKARRIDELAKAIREKRGLAESELNEAIKLFEDAYAAANQLHIELKGKIDEPANRERPEREAWVKLLEAINPQYFRLREGVAQRMKGGLRSSEAVSLRSRLNLQAAAKAAIERAGATAPAELSSDALGTEFTAALREADEAYKNASETFTNVIDGTGPQDVKDAAKVAHMLALYGWAQVNLLDNQQAAADEHMKEALVRRDAAVEAKVNLPPLPAELQPPPTAPPSTAPTTTPSETEPGTPEDPEVRTAVTAFIEALEKGDLDAVKAASQIEAGQEEFVQQLVTLVTESKKLNEAVVAKFGDEAKAMAGQLDQAAALRNVKIVVNGDEAFVQKPLPPGATPRKDLVKVDGQWKMYFGAPADDFEKQQREIVPKLTAAIPTLTADVQAGKYATIADLAKAIAEAIGMPVPGTPPPPATTSEPPANPG